MFCLVSFSDLQGDEPMKRFIEAPDRSQITLLPECLDDFVTEDNPVRVVEAFVDQLDLVVLGFEGADPAATGRPSYHPSVLLKIYIYGYLNRIASSRRLERESQRNLELMWLVGRLAPDFKTIADFRRDNGVAIRSVCRQFIVICRKLDLFSQSIIAIDGSKFMAVNNRDKNFTAGKLRARMEQVGKSIDRYLAALDTADRNPSDLTEAKTDRIKVKIDTLKHKMAEFKAIERQLQATPGGQISQTDPDARSMATSRRGAGMVGYNVQAAVDAKHHLIVAHEVTNVGSDRSALHSMAEQAREATQIKDIEVVADRGYFTGEQILACEQAGIAAYVPKPLTSNSKADGRFGKQDFVYVPEKNEYRCPAGESLIYRYTNLEAGLVTHAYWSSNCQKCAIRSQCTHLTFRRVRRWDHEGVIDDMQRRLDQKPEMMSVRRQTVEHTFGTIKHWMGYNHFLTRTLPRVGTEMSLHVLAYNLKRLIRILGIPGTIEAMAI